MNPNEIEEDCKKVQKDEKDGFSLHVLSSLKDISSTDWDRLANPGWELGRGGKLKQVFEPKIRSSSPAASNNEQTAADETVFNPFISHAFLESLESSGCAAIETGWAPRHLILKDSKDTSLGAVPAYLKSHSQGEYVFDHGWADAFYRAGGDYYPKLQVSVPFTPATGRRFLIGSGIDKATCLQALAAGLVELCNRSSASSVHATFLTQSEWSGLGELNFLQRTDQQFHWENKGYETFDAFLSDLSSRKRKAIKKERQKAVSAEGIEVEWVTGSDLTEAHWDAFYDFYLDTGARKWGQPYLNRAFFTRINEKLADRTLIILAKRDNKYIAGALNFIGSQTLYGRHWGCIEDHPFLHFELCFYQAIDFAIENKLKRVEAGAQGAHKLARGYLPTTTYSAHWIAHEGLRNAVDRFLTHERVAVENENQALNDFSPFKS